MMESEEDEPMNSGPQNSIDEDLDSSQGRFDQFSDPVTTSDSQHRSNLTMIELNLEKRVWMKLVQFIKK